MAPSDAVIGHEMTHGFDDQGRKFDAQGNLRDWWTPGDEKNFNERASCVEKQFDSYAVQDDLHENGKLVLGESIADLGGLNLAYRALQKAERGKKPALIGGMTADQRFFLSYAQIWASNDRPEFERLIVNTNPHPLGRFRAIAAPSNMQEFARALRLQGGRRHGPATGNSLPDLVTSKFGGAYFFVFFSGKGMNL